MAGIFSRISRALAPRPENDQGTEAQAGTQHRSTPPVNPEASLRKTLIDLRASAARVAESRRHVAGRVDEMATRIDQHTTNARRAVVSGQDEIAREALGSRQVLMSRLAELDAHHDELQRTEEALVRACTRLSAKLDDIATQRDGGWAGLPAEEAGVREAEAWRGVSEDFAEAGEGLARADRLSQVDVDDLQAQVPDLSREAIDQELAELSGITYRNPDAAGVASAVQDEWSS